MKVLAYMPLHYGADYIQQSIASIYDVVDKILILYAERPSHGHQSNLTCPDSGITLMSLVNDVDHDGKVIWLNGDWKYENEQRNYAHNFAFKSGYDVLLAADSDEVWETQYLKELIQEVYDRKASKCLVHMRHLWRSFNYICDDPMRQERIYYMGRDTKDLIYADKPKNQVWHFGYARDIESVRYKISCHGHSNEWLQPKDQWLQNKYCAFPPVQDVHPCCKDTWNPKPFDKNELPEIMRSHPYYNLYEIK